jgi:hypothetical protein
MNVVGDCDASGPAGAAQMVFSSYQCIAPMLKKRHYIRIKLLDKCYLVDSELWSNHMA